MSSDLNLKAVDIDGAVQESAHEMAATLEESGDTRLDFFKKAGLAGGAAMGGGALLSLLVPGTSQAAGRPPRSFGEGDIGILNFALTLEYLESEFYNEATANQASSSFITNPQTQVFLQTVTADEKAHVKFLKSALGGKAAPKPKFDFGTTTSNQTEFVATAVALENTGVSAYAGQAPNIKAVSSVKAALSIHSVEARHASVIGLIASGNRKGIVPNGPFDKAFSANKVLKIVKKTGFIQ